MGTIITASCNCGYEKEMFLGGGMDNFTTHCSFPFYCKQCRSLFETNILKKKIFCPQCKSSEIISYDNDELCREKREYAVFSWNVKEELERELKLAGGTYLCPKCNNFSMEFQICGEWD